MTYNIRLLQVSSYCLMLVIPTVYAGVSFNPAFLAGDDNAVADLNYFASGSSLKPGSYKVDLYVNKTFIRNQSVRFEVGEKNEKDLQPVFTRKELEGLGVNVKSTHWTDDMQESDVLSLEKAMDDAHAIPDMDHLRLDLSIPQAALLNTARGYIPPEQWDQGINAFLLNYSVSGNKNYASSGEARSHFASIQPGLNIGPWRLRNNSSWSQNSNDSGSTSDWENISTTLERNVQSLEGELTIGDTSTQGTLFDSVPVRGVRLASDENMLPDSQKGLHRQSRGSQNQMLKLQLSKMATPYTKLMFLPVHLKLMIFFLRQVAETYRFLFLNRMAALQPLLFLILLLPVYSVKDISIILLLLVVIVVLVLSKVHPLCYKALYSGGGVMESLYMAGCNMPRNSNLYHWVLEKILGNLGLFQ